LPIRNGELEEARNCELEEGVAALEAGRRGAAREMLARVVCADPENAAAWLWLSRCLDDAAQRRECLEHALRLEPANEAVREALARDAAAQSPRLTPRAPLPYRRLFLTIPVLALVALVYAVISRAGWPAQSAGSPALAASGVIRADEVLIASEWGGRIAAMPKGEGDAVAAGDVLVRLDTTLLEAQIEAARAAVAVAEAGLVQAEAGARAGQIAVAEAQLVQAEAARAAAAQAVSDTLALAANPQDIGLQIAVTRAQVEAAQHRTAQATALKDAAEIAKDKFEDVLVQLDERGRQKIFVRRGPVGELPAILPPEIVALLPTLGDGVHTFGDLELHLHGGSYDLYTWVTVQIPLEAHLTANNWWQAWVGVNAAVARQRGLEALLAQLYAQWAHPQNLEAQADGARAALAQSEAQVAVAQAQADGLKAGVAGEQIAALEARVAQARAALASLLAQRATMDVVSPVSGVVVDVAAYPGEVASAGATLLTVADLAEVSLVVYLPETRLGQVRVGQLVQVTVDSFAGRVFAGRVIRVADRAEFTPRNVSTQEERVNLVFAVEIQLANDDGALKPGMPADAVLEGGG
jgi:multidrug resistance efflux pump